MQFSKIMRVVLAVAHGSGHYHLASAPVKLYYKMLYWQRSSLKCYSTTSVHTSTSAQQLPHFRQSGQVCCPLEIFNVSANLLLRRCRARL